MIKNLKRLMADNSLFEVTFYLKSGKKYNAIQDGIQIFDDIIIITENNVKQNIFNINQIESIEFEKLN